MGITMATVTLVGGSRETSAELVVDIGSFLTWVRRNRLEGIGAKARREKDFRTIEGRIVRRKTGPLAIRYDGAEADIEVVFGDESDAEMLGVTALEGLGFQVDPLTRELRRSSLLAL